MSSNPVQSNLQRRIRLFDVIALTEDLPEDGLLRGHVGTVVEILADAFEVEFCDDKGHTYAQLAMPRRFLLVLNFRPVRAL